MYYESIFFDLDHTLWDYESNSRETLLELYDHHRLSERGVIPFDAFLTAFQEVNASLWVLYDHGKIDSDVIRRERFKQILERFDAYEEKLAATLSYEYLHSCPTKANLMPHALETLAYLSGRYGLTIITNGFEEIQHTKLNAGGLNGFFDHVITSQKAGCKKPAKEIFEFALRVNGIPASRAIMIGDNLITDIGGARNASIDATYFNPDKVEHTESVKYEIHSLDQLRNLL